MMTKPILKGNISLSHEPDLDTDFKDKAEGHASTSGMVFSSSFPICSILIWDVENPGSDLSSVTRYLKMQLLDLL